jgi:hypothetical protein
MAGEARDRDSDLPGILRLTPGLRRRIYGFV